MTSEFPTVAILSTNGLVAVAVSTYGFSFPVPSYHLATSALHWKLVCLGEGCLDRTISHFRDISVVHVPFSSTTLVRDLDHIRCPVQTHYPRIKRPGIALLLHVHVYQVLDIYCHFGLYLH